MSATTKSALTARRAAVTKSKPVAPFGPRTVARLLHLKSAWIFLVTSARPIWNRLMSWMFMQPQDGGQGDNRPENEGYTLPGCGPSRLDAGRGQFGGQFHRPLPLPAQSNSTGREQIPVSPRYSYGLPIDLPAEPLELPADPQAFHRDFNHRSALPQIVDQVLAVAHAGEDHDARGYG